MSAITTEIEDAIYGWVQTASGLDEDQVIWEDERGPQPQGTYIAMQITEERPFGADWSKLTPPDQSDDPDMMRYTLTGTRLATLRLECFAAGDKWQDARPDRRLATILSARRLPTIAEALRVAGVGIGTIQPVQVLRLERAQIFEPRALVEITLHLVSQVSELVSTIERVEVSTTWREGEDEFEGPEIVIERPPDPPVDS